MVVLSHQFWQERFGANPAVIGQPLKLNKQSFTIIGVTPPVHRHLASGLSTRRHRPVCL